MMTGADLDRHLHHTNLRTWLEHEAADRGTDVQRAAYARGQLSESELRRLAREALFAPLNEAVKARSIARWVPMQWSAVEHEGLGCIGRVRFSQDVVSPVAWITPRGIVGAELRPFVSPETNDSYERALELVQKASAHPWLERSHVAFQATVYRHTASCEVCIGRTDKLSLYVEVEWAGRTLTQEYAL